MATAPDSKLQELLGEFDVAMLVTRTAEGMLRARPMALAEVEPDGTLWFLTDRRSGKVNELERDGHVAVTMQSRATFVSVSGTAAPVEDRARVAALEDGVASLVPGRAGRPEPRPPAGRGPGGRILGQQRHRRNQVSLRGRQGPADRPRPDVEGDARVHGKVEL